MATIKTDLICNLNQPVNVTYLHGNLFSQDNAGNTINVFVMDNGEPATIGGTVSANVIRSDGQTVAVSGAIEGNKAYVILPQACYAVPGVVHIIIKLTQSTTITTIAAIVANVYMSTTDAVIDPGTVIPSIQALMALIEEAVDSIPTDYTGLLHTIAADYSSSKTYKVGDYAWESGVLKRCIVPITAAETYTAAHWTNAVIGDDLTNLKSAINDVGSAAYDADSLVKNICVEEISTNIYNPNATYTIGWLIDTGEVDATGTGANFATTDYIELKKNTDYIVGNLKADVTTGIGSRILVALYDGAKRYISGTFQNVVTGSPLRVTFNSGSATFLRVSTLPMHMGTTPTSDWKLMVAEGSSISLYVPYWAKYYNRMQIESGYGALVPSDIIETVHSKNIYDASQSYTTGWLTNTGGIDATGTGAYFATTDYIPIKKNTSYIVANERVNQIGSVIGSRILIALYDEYKTYVANSYQNVVNVNPMQVTFSSGSATYLRVSTLPEHMGDDATSDWRLIVQEGSALDGYTTFWKYDQTKLYDGANSAKDNVLFGKKYVSCGDSLTAGDFTGYEDEEGNTGVHSDAFSMEYGTYKTYPYWIASRNNMTLVNEAVNGSTMAISKEYIDGTESSIAYRSPFSYQRYTQIPDDADYITIWFGVNDKDHTYLGTINDDDNTTFYGAWNVVLPYLVEHHPNAKIGIVITFGIPDSAYTQAVREVAEKWGIPYYDFPRGKQSPIIIRNKDTGYAVDSDMVDLRLTQFRVASDNNHPNLAAHKFESTCLEAWLRSL